MLHFNDESTSSFVEQKECEHSYFWYQSDEKKKPTEFNNLYIKNHSGDILLIQKEVHVR